MRINLEKREVVSIHPYSRNSKNHGPEDIALIAASIERFGFNDPIAIDADGTIIEGHGRYEAAVSLGMEEVPVLILSDLTDEQKRLYRIAHNKIALSSTFDFQRLAEALGEIVGEDITYNMLGFADAVADNLMNVVFGGEGQRAPTVSPVEPFEVIWEEKEQRKKWQDFLKKVQARFPNMSEAEALDEFIQSCGIMEGRRASEAESGPHEEIRHEQ